MAVGGALGGNFLGGLTGILSNTFEVFSAAANVVTIGRPHSRDTELASGRGATAYFQF